MINEKNEMIMIHIYGGIQKVNIFCNHQFVHEKVVEKVDLKVFFELNIFWYALIYLRIATLPNVNPKYSLAGHFENLR